MKSFYSPDVPTKVRLIGSQPNAGRIEVYHNGLWGTVCNKNWGLTNAAVVCRMLGYRGATLPTCGGSCTQGTGPIWLSGVVCKGSEKTIDECTHGEWGSHSCKHEKDAGVVCMPAINAVSTTVPLKPTTTAFAGILLIIIKAATCFSADALFGGGVKIVVFLIRYVLFCWTLQFYFILQLAVRK